MAMGQPAVVRSPGVAPGRQRKMRIDIAQMNDPIPDALLDFLEALPLDSRVDGQGDQSLDEAVQPLQKRPRVEAIETIAVTRESFTLTRPSPRGSLATPREQPITRRHVERFLKLQYDETERILIVASRPKSPYGTFRSELSLGRPRFAETALAALHVAGHSRDPEDEDGSLWTAIDIDFERKGEKDYIRFSLSIQWNTSTHSLRDTSQRKISQRVLDMFLPRDVSEHEETGEKLSPQAFYQAAFMTDNTQLSPSSFAVPGLVTGLYPFQLRALQWLLNREGVSLSKGRSSESPSLEPLRARLTDIPLSFKISKDADGNPIYVSDLYHVVLKDVGPIRERERALRGGILAEEMGLGKTVETISLILTHKRPPVRSPIFEAHTSEQLRPTPATLIVTPPTLSKQWISECEKHAPGLRVLVYDGVKRYKGHESELIEDMANHDVVITTYSVLQAEIYFAEPPPQRDMRQERRYHRPRSPLVQLSWWRVCLDEAQQIESGVSNAAKVARLIPRVNAWGVTGTPVKEDIKDLWGLLLFLKYEPFASSITIWKGLTTSHKELFKPLFNRISLRHTKRAVRAELQLPAQKRYVVTMPFTAIEEQHYQSQFKALVRSFGLDINGAPLRQDWDPEDSHTLELMRRALAQLRQTVLHPEMGPGRLRAAAQRNKPLRSIEEVLDLMIEQTESTIRNEQRAYIAKKLQRGQLLENSPRVKEAREIWEEAYKEIEALVKDCREQLQIAVENARQAGIDENAEDLSSHNTDGHDDSEHEEITRRLTECRRRLRSALHLEHQAVFFIASANFQIKSNEEMTAPDSEEFKQLEKLEIEGYELAKQKRKEILREAHSKAWSYMMKISEDAASQSFVEIPEIESLPFQGLESRRVLEKLEALGSVLNEQANLIDDWRESVIQLLLRPLVDEEEEEVELTGEEYENSTKIQEDLMVYTLILRAAIADRQDALSGLENERVRYETKYAGRQAENGEGPSPEKLLELLEQRLESKPAREEGSFRGIVTDLRELTTKLRHEAANGSDRARVELEIVQKQLDLTQAQIGAQSKAATSLERELDRFTSAMNARVEYYRQLQAVSDTVAVREGKENEDTDACMQKYLAEEQASQRKFIAAQSEHRYLLHLKDAGQGSNEPRLCVICQTNFTLGVLTICGHQFCKDCIMMWFKAHHNCPVCKKHLTHGMLHDITLKKQELKVHQDQQNSQSKESNAESSSSQKTKSTSIYREFSEDKLAAIKNIRLDGPSYATKIDTLIKHLLWLREEDPGAKSIIFSQFREFLDVLGKAFDRYRIGFTSFDQRGGIVRFKEEPGIECFLMDARAHASGLNLVNASHVFLCEPLLNTALELQAIARVDRIGQEHETTVWLYVVEGTVEESIYNLSVRRRLEHMGRNRDRDGRTGASSDDPGQLPDIATTTTAALAVATPDAEIVSDLNLEDANSMELQQAALSKMMSKDKKLGEEVDKSDLWECLFGHVKGSRGSDSGRGDGGASSSAGPSAPAPNASSDQSDERFSNPLVIGFLAGEAAEERRGRNS